MKIKKSKTILRKYEYKIDYLNKRYKNGKITYSYYLKRKSNIWKNYGKEQEKYQIKQVNKLFEHNKISDKKRISTIKSIKQKRVQKEFFIQRKKKARKKGLKLIKSLKHKNSFSDWYEMPKEKVNNFIKSFANKNIKYVILIGSYIEESDNIHYFSDVFTKLEINQIDNFIEQIEIKRELLNYGQISFFPIYHVRIIYEKTNKEKDQNKT